LFGLVPRGLGIEKPTGPKNPSLKKLTRPKSQQKPYGLGLAHGHFFLEKKIILNTRKNRNN